MIGYHLVLLILPMLAGLQGAAQLQPAAADVNLAIVRAVQAADDYQPAWVAEAQNTLGSQNSYSVEVIDAIDAAAESTGVAPEVIWAVAFTESKGFHMKPDGAVKRGSAGEVGIMQIKPFWSKALKSNYGVDLDLYNVTDNIMAGALILQRGGDDTKIALSYYNTGKRYKTTAYQRKVSSYLEKFEPAI